LIFNNKSTLNQKTDKVNKICLDLQTAIHDIPNGSSILIGGFGYCGFPMNLVNSLKVSGVNNLTVVSHGCGSDGNHDNN